PLTAPEPEPGRFEAGAANRRRGARVEPVQGFVLGDERGRTRPNLRPRRIEVGAHKREPCGESAKPFDERALDGEPPDLCARQVHSEYAEQELHQIGSLAHCATRQYPYMPTTHVMYTPVQ